jgi:PHAX RNA-binding domain
MQSIPHPDEEPQAVSTKEREPSINEVASMIAQTLGETEQIARQQLQRIVWALGRTQSRQLFEQTIQIEEHGGLMLQNGSRRRTPGGVFFHLAYTTGQPKEGRTLQRPVYKKPKKEKKEAPQVEPKKPFQSPLPKPVPQSIPLFAWNERIPAVKEALQEKGQATVKMTVIGRPGKIVDKGTCIVTVMESTKMPTLPKGLPTPTSVATKYAIYIASKQWKKVEEAIKDPEDMLIVEGFPKTDPEVSAIAVFATNVTTKKLQMTKKQSSAASS